jgi:hypothetical protein
MPLSSDARYTLGHAHNINTTKLIGRVLSKKEVGRVHTADQTHAHIRRLLLTELRVHRGARPVPKQIQKSNTGFCAEKKVAVNNVK